MPDKTKLPIGVQHNDMLGSLEVISQEDSPRNGVLATIGGKFSTSAEPSRNDRNYVPELWRSVVSSDRVKEMLETKTFYGELSHPPRAAEYLSELQMQNVSHNITKLTFDEQSQDLMGTIDILDTPSGRIANTLLKYGSKLGISSRGIVMDDNKYGSKANEMTPDNYYLVTFDLVALPGIMGARLDTVTESLAPGRKTRLILESLNELQHSIDEAVEQKDDAALAVLEAIATSIKSDEEMDKDPEIQKAVKDLSKREEVKDEEPDVQLDDDVVEKDKVEAAVLEENNESEQPVLSFLDAKNKFNRTEDGTYDLQSGAAISFDTGYQVSFERPDDAYTPDQFNQVIEDLIARTGSKVYLGVWGGEKEISFHIEDFQLAMDIARQYYQDAVWDWAQGDAIVSKEKEVLPEQPAAPVEEPAEAIKESEAAKVNTKYVGLFNEKDLDEGLDKIAVEKAKKETGLKYTNTKLVKKNGKTVGLKIWVCDADSMDLSMESVSPAEEEAAPKIIKTKAKKKMVVKKNKEKDAKDVKSTLEDATDGVTQSDDIQGGMKSTVNMITDPLNPDDKKKKAFLESFDNIKTVEDIAKYIESLDGVEKAPNGKIIINKDTALFNTMLSMINTMRLRSDANPLAKPGTSITNMKDLDKEYFGTEPEQSEYDQEDKKHEPIKKSIKGTENPHNASLESALKLVKSSTNKVEKLSSTLTEAKLAKTALENENELLKSKLKSNYLTYTESLSKKDSVINELSAKVAEADKSRQRTATEAATQFKSYKALESTNEALQTNLYALDKQVKLLRDTNNKLTGLAAESRKEGRIRKLIEAQSITGLSLSEDEQAIRAATEGASAFGLESLSVSDEQRLERMIKQSISKKK